MDSFLDFLQRLAPTKADYGKRHSPHFEPSTGRATECSLNRRRENFYIVRCTGIEVDMKYVGIQQLFYLFLMRRNKYA